MKIILQQRQLGRFQGPSTSTDHSVIPPAVKTPDSNFAGIKMPEAKMPVVNMSAVKMPT